MAGYSLPRTSNSYLPFRTLGFKLCLYRLQLGSLVLPSCSSMISAPLALSDKGANFVCFEALERTFTRKQPIQCLEHRSVLHFHLIQSTSPKDSPQPVSLLPLPWPHLFFSFFAGLTLASLLSLKPSGHTQAPAVSCVCPSTWRVLPAAAIAAVFLPHFHFKLKLLFSLSLLLPCPYHKPCAMYFIALVCFSFLP